MKRSGGAAVALTGMGLLAAVLIIGSAIRASELGGVVAAVGTIVIVVGGFGALLIVLFFLPTRPSVRLLRQLRERFPAETVVRVAGTFDTRIGLNAMLGRPPYPMPPRYQVLVITGDAVEFWTAPDGKPLLRLGSDEFDDVSLRDVSTSGDATQASLILQATTAGKRRVVLPIVVMRDRGSGFLPDDAAAVSRVAAAIEAALTPPARTPTPAPPARP